MFDFIFDNIFILIPVAIFIGLRILEARRKRQNSSPEKNKKLYSEKREESGIPHWEAEKKAAPPTVHHKGISPSGAPLTTDLSPTETPVSHPNSSDVDSFPTLPVSKTMPKAQVPEHSSTGTFPINLENLSSLKKAVIMSEILGPPKGLTQE